MENEGESSQCPKKNLEKTWRDPEKARAFANSKPITLLCIYMRALLRVYVYVCTYI